MKHVVRTKDTWRAYRVWWCNARKFVQLKGFSFDVKIKLENKHKQSQTYKQIYICFVIISVIFFESLSEVTGKFKFREYFEYWMQTKT